MMLKGNKIITFKDSPGKPLKRRPSARCEPHPEENGKNGRIDSSERRRMFVNFMEYTLALFVLVQRDPSTRSQGFAAGLL